MTNKTGANYTFHDADQVEHLLTGERGTVEGEGNNGFTVRWGMRPPFSRAFYQYGSQGAAKIRLVADGATFDPFAAAQEERQRHEREQEQAQEAFDALSAKLSMPAPTSHAALVNEVLDMAEESDRKAAQKPAETFSASAYSSPSKSYAAMLGRAEGTMIAAKARVSGILVMIDLLSRDYPGVADALSMIRVSVTDLRDYLEKNITD